MARQRKHKYGITVPDFDAMRARQDDTCAVCRSPFDLSVKSLRPHVDHDHATGRVRGLLCHNCNVLLGHAREDADRLRAAIEYLERACRTPIA